MNKKSTANVNVPLDIATGNQSRTRKASAGSRLMTVLAGQYASLTNVQKSAWNTMNQPVQNVDGMVPPPPRFGVNGWAAFYACNSALMSANQPLVHDPHEFVQPVNLPPIRVDITYVGVGNTPAITLIPNIAYAAGPTIALWATPAVALGNGSTTVFRARSYYKIGVITGGIPTAGVNVASQYLSLFPSVPQSSKIGFKLMAVNPGGYHSRKEFAVGLTPLLQMAASLEEGGDEDLHLASGE